jgi:hypothetical protein
MNAWAILLLFPVAAFSTTLTGGPFSQALTPRLDRSP